MIINILLLLIGLVLLVKGSGYFVSSASSIAKKLGISEFVIGLTLVAIGTSLPELVSSIFASIKHESGFVIGTITGANIANIGLVVGIAAIIHRIKTRKQMLIRDGYIMLFSFLLLFIFIFNNIISRIEGIIMLIIFFAYIIFLFETKKDLKGKYGFKEFIKSFFKFKYILTIKSRLLTNFTKNKNKISSTEKRRINELFRAGIIKDILLIILSGAFVIFGAKYLVDQAIFFANLFNIPKMLIGILLAIGTTMPEMSVAIAASRKRLGNIVIGNAIGSCITNTLLILGISSIIFPLSVLKLSLVYIVPFMLLMGILLLLFIKRHWGITKLEGIIFILLYLLFLIFLFFMVIT
ncbi:MAG: calcium/sodium antiporter [Nanoarchaeota archaeon]|nr:calcium/sodium antiporter [Nanoarchaeota archaeon]